MEFADIETQYAGDARLRPADVAIVDAWQRQQRHLPAPLHPIETALFLHSRDYSCEAAKTAIDAYYTLRTHCRELFAQRHPLAGGVRQALDTCMASVLPERTPDGHLVLYARLLDRDPARYVFDEVVKVCDMVLEVALKQRGCAHDGLLVVIDLEGIQVAHLLKWSATSLRKSLVYGQTAVPVRLKAIHFVNGVPFIERILALMRPVLRHADALHVHFGDNATLAAFVCMDCMPMECGGRMGSVVDYYKSVTRRHLERCAGYFEIEARQLVDEAMRPEKLNNMGDWFGVDGTFKKLDID